MSGYDDYLATIDDLMETLSAAEHMQSDARQHRKQVMGALEKDQRQEQQRLQEAASASASAYSQAAQALNSSPLAEDGVRLPQRVRPAGNGTDPDVAVRKQEQASRRLTSLLTAYESELKGRASAASEAAAALAARREALSASPEPEPEPESPEPARPRVGPLRELPLVWILVAVPTAVLGAVVWSWKGVLVAVVLAGLIAFWLVGFQRVSVARLFRRGGVARQDVEPVRKTSNGPLERATRLGTMSGFEPKALESVTLERTPLMHGDPGQGLAESGFDAQAIKFGQLGEQNFAKALQKEGLLSRYATFWSIHMIGEDLVSKEAHDLDCAIVTGHTIWLIDLKYYRSGDVVHRVEGDQFCTYDVATGQMVGHPKKMSRNMDMAITRFGQRFKNYYRYFRVESRVVLVPTNSGVGRIEGVQWPGGIRAVTLPDFLAELRSEPAFQENLEGKLVRKTFTGLLKS